MAYLDDLRARERGLLDNPDSFANTAGYRFGFDQAMQGAQRGLSTQRGSGNVLAELTRLGAGYAGQQRGAELDRLGAAIGREGNYDLGNRRLGWDQEFGRGSLANDRRRGDQSFGLGMGRLGLDSMNSERDAYTNWFRAVTDRGRARSDDFYRGQDNTRGWYDRFF